MDHNDPAGAGTLVAMAAIPESTRSSIRLRLLDHARQRWPQLARTDITYRGAFAYVAGVLPDGEFDLHS
ncbi:MULTISPECIES: hypothetical protein [Protofrankia]|uniref:hypothetical protein n=1 Tax=Protofrankia TaxID=2994361 RepID=UPI0002E63E8F|nr:MULTISPECIES: hypothetical protein [Protofrankia]